MVTKIRMLAWIVWSFTRRPPDRKTAWVAIAVWAAALILPGIAVGVNPARGLDMTTWVGWSNLICICLDSFMLYTAIRGLLWVRSPRRQGRRRKADTLAG